MNKDFRFILQTSSGKPWEQAIKDMVADYKRSLYEATVEVVQMIHGSVPPYPAPSGRRMNFKSLKQYFFVLWSIRDQTLRVPYRRTGTLGRSITTEVKEITGNFVGAIGTNVPYAPWVISTEPVGDIGGQAEYHQGVWFTLQEHVQRNMDKVREIYRKHIQQFLSPFK